MLEKYYLLAVNLFILAVFRTNADICDLCVCEKTVCNGSAETFAGEHSCSADFNDIYRCDGNHKVWRKFNQTIELDNIEWPNKNGTVALLFNRLKLTYLTKVLCASRASASPTLTCINLDHNVIESITTDPFQYCRHLKSVSIAYNLVSHLAKDFIKSTYSLERLNVSHNMLAEFNGDILSNNQRLIALDVSHNQITTLKLDEILNASPKLEAINAADNLLFVVNGDIHVKYSNLKYLNLAGNKLTVLTGTSFAGFPNLMHLDLSSNDLSNIENDAFAKLQGLRSLDLSNNILNDLSLKLADSLENLRIASNNLQFWPIVAHPQSLKSLEFQNNRLVEMFYTHHGKNDIEFSNINRINVSHNHIESLPTTLHYPALTIFDLSYNRFEETPHSLGRQAPNLDWLRMSGNPLRKIEFPQEIFARRLEFSELPLLSELDASQFDSITSTSGCIELTVSHCPLLRSIVNSFLKLSKLCFLDLSHNGLSVVNQNWANWAALSRGINLQGNPISCTCVESQWLLDTFLPMMYNRTDQQHFLDNFRCASPQRFRQQRLMKYYRHEAMFCDEAAMSRARFGLFRSDPKKDGGTNTGADTVTIAIIVALLTIIVALSIAIIVVWMRRRRGQLANKNNRRYSNGGFF